MAGTNKCLGYQIEIGCVFICLIMSSVSSGTCDYYSQADDPCGEIATDGSCADYHQVFAEKTDKYISSPNYPKHYPDNIVCRWVISACHCTAANPDAKIRLIVEMMDYDMQNSPSCTKDFVEIKDGKRLWHHSVATYCGNSCQNSENYTYSSDMHLLLTFQTNMFSPSEPQRYTGFKARYRCVELDSPLSSPIVLKPMNHLLIGLSIFLLAMFTSAVVLLVLREKRRSSRLID